MNLTLDEYIEGFERSVRELPRLLSEWDTLDEVLQEEYADELSWMLAVRPDVLARAAREGRKDEIALRLQEATAGLPVDRLALMGIRVREPASESHRADP